MGFRIFRRRTLPMVLVSIAISLLLLINIFPYMYVDFVYLIRPLWDKESNKWDEVVVHYYSEGLTMEERCHAHGWTVTPPPPEGTPKAKVYDAVIFSVELDMLEIRMRELLDVVDHFVILESTHTFTGHDKELVFANNKERFEFAADKIIYKSVPLGPLQPGEQPWVNEGAMRDQMTVLLRESGVRVGDHLIFSDVDEVPSRHTVELLSSCLEVPQAIHLNMHSYQYSYEFPVDDGGKNTPSFRRWTDDLYYTRGQASAVLFANAGWHCSFCFRHLQDFVFKMDAYSHSDRVRYSFMKDPAHIQDAICNGKDLFGMFPEAYNYQDLIHRLGPIPKTKDAVSLPTWVVKNSDKFRFLLPGGCKRE
ncbi:hypothetical protein BGZ75_003490 [Mortierella antarctica]|nr:hypothetical protein BGZ67_004490 [Mortierella alpina]KAF9990163.1 hypothetical protein BGZ75_003490 [Mortierella antarctica]